MYDYHRRPRRGSVTNNSKKSPANHASERLEAEYHCIDYDFYGPGVNPISSYPFLRAFFLIIPDLAIRSCYSGAFL